MAGLGLYPLTLPMADVPEYGGVCLDSGRQGVAISIFLNGLEWGGLKITNIGGQFFLQRHYMTPLVPMFREVLQERLGRLEIIQGTQGRRKGNDG